jgi:[ribosomal protein S5]-alanine N-acetyltransferase
MITLESERLRLFPCTLPMLKAVKASSPELEKLLGATVPDSWPQKETREALPYFTGIIEREPNMCQWLLWAVILKSSSILIGDAGFKGGAERGVVELGYSILPEYRNQGYASEAVGLLTQWALTQEGVDTVVARCSTDNLASIRVLQKTGMQVALNDGDEIIYYKVQDSR